MAAHARDVARNTPAPGTPVWEGRQPAESENASSQGRSVSVDAVGNMLVTGFIEGADGNFDIVTYKYSPDGGLLWSRHYDYSWYDTGFAVTSDAQLNVVVAGASQDPNNPRDIYLQTYYTDYVLLKYDPEGNLIFDVTASGNDKDNIPAAACTDTAGGIYVTGRAKDETDTHNAYYTVKFSPEGAILWERQEDWGTEAVAAGIGLCPDGVAVTGYVWDGEQANYDIKTVKYSLDSGDVTAFKTFKVADAFYDEIANALSTDTKGNVYVTGRTSDSGGVALTLKLDGELDPVWYGPLYLYEQENQGCAVGVDEHGRVFVAGNIRVEDEKTSLMLVVYGPEGTLIDTRTVPLGEDFSVSGMTVEPDGELLLTGTSFETDNHDTMTSLRLAAYPADVPSRFNLEDEFIRGEDVSLSNPPMPMLRKVELTMTRTFLYGCLPAAVFTAEPIGMPGDYEYSFYVTRGEGLVWEKTRDYSPIRYWIMPPVEYKNPVTGVMVQVRLAGSGMDYQAKEWMYLDNE